MGAQPPITRRCSRIWIDRTQVPVCRRRPGDRGAARAPGPVAGLPRGLRRRPARSGRRLTSPHQPRANLRRSNAELNGMRWQIEVRSHPQYVAGVERGADRAPSPCGPWGFGPGMAGSRAGRGGVSERRRADRPRGATGVLPPVGRPDRAARAVPVRGTQRALELGHALALVSQFAMDVVETLVDVVEAWSDTTNNRFGPPPPEPPAAGQCERLW